jgi:CspA family cold shock protein
MSDKVYYGKVIWFDARKGMGFIEWSKDNQTQKDMFVHFSDIKANGFKTLYKDQQVSFKIGANKNNMPKAIEVEVLSK